MTHNFKSPSGLVISQTSKMGKNLGNCLCYFGTGFVLRAACEESCPLASTTIIHYTPVSIKNPHITS